MSQFDIVRSVKEDLLWNVQHILQDEPEKVDCISYDFHSLLDIAIQNDSILMVEMLLQHGANPNHKDNYENDSYQKAVLLRKSGILKMLFTKSKYTIIDINNVYRDNKTLLMYATSNVDIRCVLVLLKNGANPNIITSDTKTALTELFTHNTYNKNKQRYNNNIYNIFQLLLEYKVDLFFKTLHGVSYLHMCVIMNFDKIIQILTTYISLESIDIYGKTPLMYAIEFGSARNIEYLIDKGSNIYHIDKNGNTLLHICHSYMYNIIEKLIKKKCDILYINNEGKAPIDIFIQSSSLISLFLSNYPVVSRSILDNIITRNNIKNKPYPHFLVKSLHWTKDHFKYHCNTLSWTPKNHTIWDIDIKNYFIFVLWCLGQYKVTIGKDVIFHIFSFFGNTWNI